MFWESCVIILTFQTTMSIRFLCFTIPLFSYNTRTSFLCFLPFLRFVFLGSKQAFIYGDTHSLGGFLYFNPFLFNISKIISPKKYFQIWPFWSRLRRRRDQITLSRHMHWRGKVCHVRRRLRRRKRCHATPADVTVLFCRTIEVA
jgi:hypothetical protein